MNRDRMNLLDNLQLDEKSFSYLDIQAQDRWEPWTPELVDWDITGTPPEFPNGFVTAVGRFHIVGRQCYIQVQITSDGFFGTMTSTVQISYIPLPIAAGGYCGNASMVSLNGLYGIGHCVIVPSLSRIYVPSVGPTLETLGISAWYEI